MKLLTLGPALSTRVVVFAAGAGGDPGRHLPLLEALADNGCRVVAPCFRRFDTPRPSTVELVSRLRDLIEALEREASPEAEVTAIGHSIGGWAALCLAGATPYGPIVTIDAGLKAFATDGPAPRPATAPFSDSTYAFFGDEHGAITRPPGTEVRLADRIELVTPHCDPTVDRYDDYHVVHGDTVVAIIPIDAARASR